MSKKIYLKENSIVDIVNGRTLPRFLYDAIKTHTTSLGDCVMYPDHGDVPFEYLVVKSRYKEVCEELESLGLDGGDIDGLVTLLSKLIRECVEIEKPIRNVLERICENSLNKLFAIPIGLVTIDCKLVDTIKFNTEVRIRPEYGSEYEFADLSDIDFSKKAIEKRRFVDALVMGGSYSLYRVSEVYKGDLDKINKDLFPLYEKIRVINDYLLFARKEEIDDENTMQGSYVETKVVEGGKTSEIAVQGLVFPLLYQELIRGFLELFATHGMPKDVRKMDYIIKKADFLLAEPWDLRLGVGLWHRIFGEVRDSNMIPYVFTKLVSCKNDNFFKYVKEILSKTSKGRRIVDKLISTARDDSDYQKFKNRINVKNLNKSMINDSYFNGACVNGFDIDGEKEEKIIESE